MKFPKDFLWGAATASYQIEGGNVHSALVEWGRDKGWDHVGEAANSWESLDQDLELIKQLHLKAYRFSVEWSRLEPRRGEFDEAALARYADFARKLAVSGVRPFLTLHHFSEPAWLLRAHPRGWEDAAVGDAFARIVEKIAPAFTDAVKDWITFNEPTLFMIGAYGISYFPPGGLTVLGFERKVAEVVGPNFARAHGLAYDALKKLDPEARIGVAQNVYAIEPARPQDEEAARRWDDFAHRKFLDAIKDKLDFLGINYYSRIFVRESFLPLTPLKVVPGYAELEAGIGKLLFKLVGGRRDDAPRSAMGWEIVPEGFEKVLLDYSKHYGKPVYVTENGMALPSDITREKFIRDHVAAMGRALAAGADVRGYFHWSLIDNFEWGSYRPRFGLYTRDRRPSDGAALYARICESGELPHG